MITPFSCRVASILAAKPDIEIVWLGSDAESAIQISRTLTPKIMMLCVHMPGGGVQAVNELRPVDE